MKLKLNSKKQNGFTLTSVMVTCAVTAIVLPTLHRIAMVPVIAQAKAANFQVAESAATMFTARAIKDQAVGPTPNDCSVTNDAEDVFVYTITCTAGTVKAVKAEVARTFTLLDPNNASPAAGIGIYSDVDRDGFDDVTGLPTHYFECYSGWKGIGTLKNNCKLGGPYVIPAYKHFYDDPTSG